MRRDGYFIKPGGCHSLEPLRICGQQLTVGGKRYEWHTGTSRTSHDSIETAVESRFGTTAYLKFHRTVIECTGYIVEPLFIYLPHMCVMARIAEIAHTATEITARRRVEIHSDAAAAKGMHGCETRGFHPPRHPLAGN